MPRNCQIKIKLRRPATEACTRAAGISVSSVFRVANTSAKLTLLLPGTVVVVNSVSS